jgi:toxin HigB-1
MIKSFSDKRTEALYDNGKYKKVDPALAKKAVKKIDQVKAATRIEDFYFPPSNHFEKLEGHNPTRYSIRVNDQWRISFEWQDSDAYNVLFEDYH